MKWLTGIVVVLITAAMNWSEEIKPTKVEEESLASLGWYLFFDSKLSGSGRISCSTCHNPRLAFTDGYRRSFNAYGEKVKHNSPSLLNVADNQAFNWASPEVTTLRIQLHGPFGNQHPGEMEIDQNSEKVLTALDQRDYIHRYIQDWNLRSDCGKLELIEIALVSYIQKLERRHSRFDTPNNLTREEEQGHQAFLESGCGTCHGGRDFDVSKPDLMDPPKANLYYRVPTLRNVAVTSPYLHDGSETKLASAIQKHAKVSSDKISKIILFLETLTDTSYGDLPFFYDPIKSSNEI